MCRGCLSWTNCVTAAGWQELMISVAATGLMHLKAMPWCWRAGGGCQRAWNRGERKSTALDLAVVQLPTVSTRGADGSLFLFSLTNQKTHMHLSVSPKKREGGGSSWWCQAPSKQRRIHMIIPFSGGSDSSFVSSLFGCFAVLKTSWGKGTMLVCLYQCSILS